MKTGLFYREHYMKNEKINSVLITLQTYRSFGALQIICCEHLQFCCQRIEFCGL